MIGSHPSPRRRVSAFTLIELLVVIAIIGILIALLLPAVQKIREAAARLQCQNNLKQMGLALHNYHDNFQSLTPGYVAWKPYVDGATDTTPGWAWSALILPYLEQEPLYNALRLNLPVEHAQNTPAVQTLVKVYLCPSDQTPAAAFAVPDAFGKSVGLLAPSSYTACVGGDESDVPGPSGQGVFYRNSRTRLTDITDGTSTTILIGEKSWGNANGVWAGAVNNGVILRGKQNPNPGSGAAFYPAAVLVQAHSHLNNALTDTDGGLDDFSSRHTNGSNFLYADGSVHFLRSVPGDTATGYTPDSLVLQALGTRANNDNASGLD
jgi:prepilin-type N-terminal cleavage/methylation domain-containing protein/prepilin-type processing-associated H-X9-DG protein